MVVKTPDIHDLFNEAIARDSDEERCQFLDEECGNDPKVRGRVEALLRAHSEAGGFFGGQPPPASVSTLLAHSILEPIGTIIGPYKLREVLGEGGMGIVYFAEQEKPIRRKVALKVIKPGMDTREVIARFEAERQALAMMNHPNIAKVLDAGSTAAGRPYFVMELVKGSPITDFCDQQKLGTRERLQLFMTVCQAVQHAHQRGLIHRDLKPSNVLVEIHDVQPVPKVIDFGVAKAVGQQLTEKTLFTGFHQMLGTPMYMSPEQAGQSSLDVDTRSDVYSLGVLLYELLTGTTPFDKETFSKVGYVEMRRMIREDEPVHPSHRVSTLAAEAYSTISRQRGHDERQFARAFRGDLDWIVMKALTKDRNRRYQSASALADDVERYLNDVPVEACPPSMAYRTHTFVRRHRHRVITSAILALLFISIALLSGSAYINRRRNTDFIRQQVKQSLAAAKAAVEAGDLSLAGQRLATTNAHLELWRSSLPLMSNEVDELAAEIFDRRADRKRFEEFTSLARDAQDRMGYGSEWGGDRVAETALNIWNVMNDPHWCDHLDQSWLTAEQRRLIKETAYDTIIVMASHLLRDSSADVQRTLDRLDCARAFHEPTRAFWLVREKALKFAKDDAALLENTKHLESSVAKDAIDHFIYTGPWNRTEENIREFQAALRLQPDHFYSLFYLGREFWLRANRTTEAVGCFTACIALRPKSSWSYGHRAACHQRIGNLDEAQSDFTAAVEFASQNHERATALADRATFSLETGDQGGADRDIKSCLKLAEDADLNVDSAREIIAIRFNNLAWFLVTRQEEELRKSQLGVELAERAVRGLPNISGLWNTLGVVRYRNGNWSGAIDALQRSIDLGAGGDSCDWLFMAMSHWRLGHQHDANRWYDKAIERLANNSSDNEELRRFVAEATELLHRTTKDDEACTRRPTPVQVPHGNN